MLRLRRRKTKARVIALVVAGLIAANAVIGIGVALTLASDGGDGAAGHAALASPQMAAAAGAMVFALSGFASALAMRLSTPRETAKE